MRSLLYSMAAAVLVLQASLVTLSPVTVDDGRGRIADYLHFTVTYNPSSQYYFTREDYSIQISGVLLNASGGIVDYVDFTTPPWSSSIGIHVISSPFYPWYAPNIGHPPPGAVSVRYGYIVTAREWGFAGLSWVLLASKTSVTGQIFGYNF